MGAVRDIKLISETAVTSIYCAFSPGQALCGHDIYPCNSPQGRGCFLSPSLDEEIEAQRSDAITDGYEIIK